MVYFNCCSCGTGLKKNQVEQHFYACRAKQVSCIDCNKDFRNEEYKMHIKCLTESERYESKSTFVSKANKGELKQNAWLEKVSQAVESFRGSAKAKSILENLTDFPNVPRKKAKFFNFMKNSFRSFGINDSILEEIWIVIETFDKATKQQQQQQQPPNIATNNPASNGVKRKLDFGGEDVEKKDEPPTKIINNENGAKFDWINEIKKICSKKNDNQIKFEKLIKKLYKKYKSDEKSEEESGEEAAREAFIKKLKKKLKKNSNEFTIVVNEENGSESNGLESTLIKLNPIS